MLIQYWLGKPISNEGGVVHKEIMDTMQDINKFLT